MKRAVVGGTFDLLHKGHRILLKKAFGQSFDVVVGLTSDSLARKGRERAVESFQKRKKELKRFIEKELGAKPKIIKIEDRFGITLKKDFDRIVVSPETYKNALLINQERKKGGRKPIKIIKIPFVLAEDKKPISSTRISRGEIDREGRLLK